MKKCRERILSAIEKQPAMLALLTTELVGGEAPYQLIYGRLDEARGALRDLQITLSLAGCDAGAGMEPGKPLQELRSPERVLQKSRRGKPRSQEAFRKCLLEGIRYARALERIHLIHTFRGPMAYFETAGFEDLLPGVEIPRKVRRQRFLVRLLHGHKSAPSALEVFSITGTPLFVHPLPRGFLTGRYDALNEAPEGDFRSLEG